MMKAMHFGCIKYNANNKMSTSAFQEVPAEVVTLPNSEIDT